MATDRTFASEAVRTTTTMTEPLVQPREVDTHAKGDTIDLDDERAVSVALYAIHDNPNTQCCMLEVSMECSSDQISWREIGKFDRFKADSGAVFRQNISFVSDRYCRAVWRIAKGYSPDKGGVRFSVLGRST